MHDQAILEDITQLVREKHRLREGIAGSQLGDDAYARLQAFTIGLDQYGDLLRQRQGLRDAERNPDDARLRPAEIVE
jgi:hypothetical protein